MAMVLDHVVALPNDRDVVADAMRRSVRWAERCQAAATRADQALFAIVQGGLDAELRAESAERLAALDFAGYAIGGLSVGESPAEMYAALDVTVAACCRAIEPRYLMGVGRPIDLLEAIARGVDLFDCVMPTRNGRNALAFTDAGPFGCAISSTRSIASRSTPTAPAWPAATAAATCGTCSRRTRCSGPILVSIHNLTYYQRLLAEARQAIAAGPLCGISWPSGDRRLGGRQNDELPNDE